MPAVESPPPLSDEPQAARASRAVRGGRLIGRLVPPTAVLVGAAGGVVTSEAKAEFERAVALNTDDPKANYFLGLAAEQDHPARLEPALQGDPHDPEDVDTTAEDHAYDTLRYLLMDMDVKLPRRGDSRTRYGFGGGR